MTHHRGFSLIEVVAAITISTALMGTATGVLYTLMRLQHTGRDHVRQAAVVQQLAEQFRRDAHAAVDTRLLGNAGRSGLTFVVGPDATVTYESQAAAIRRTERSAAKTARDESFVLPPESSAAFQLETGAPRTATLLITGKQPSPVVRIVALPGMDHRFESAKAAKESR